MKENNDLKNNEKEFGEEYGMHATGKEIAWKTIAFATGAGVLTEAVLSIFFGGGLIF